MSLLCLHKVAENPRTGERVCVRCGLVFNPSLSSEPSRKDDEQSFERAGELATLERRHDHNLGTEIYPIFGRYPGVRPETRRWWNRTRRHLRSRPSSERRLIKTFCDIERICSYMGLHRGVRDELSYAARKLAGRMVGFPRLRTLTILTYLACNYRHAPRSIGEIDRAFLEIFGDEYRRIRNRRLDRTSEISGLDKATQLRIREMARFLGYGNG